MAKPLTSTPERQIGAEQFAALVRSGLDADNRASKAKAQYTDNVAAAVENANLHRGAFNLVKRLAKMDELKRKDFLAAFGLYCDHAEKKGLFGAEHTGDLVGRTADDPKSDDSERQTVNNVTRLRKGIKKLEPSEGEPAAPVH